MLKYLTSFDVLIIKKYNKLRIIKLIVNKKYKTLQYHDEFTQKTHLCQILSILKSFVYG